MNQEETDTCVALYLKYAVQMGYKSAVVRTPDYDYLFIKNTNLAVEKLIYIGLQYAIQGVSYKG